MSSSRSSTYGNDVWVIKEYGNKESYTKFLIIPYLMECILKPYHFAKPIYMFEDDQVLLEFIRFGLTLILYDLKDITCQSIEFQNILEICVESLISPSCYYARRYIRCYVVWAWDPKAIYMLAYVYVIYFLLVLVLHMIYWIIVN